MIRILIRWSLILVVVATTFFSWGIVDSPIAIALTEAEVLTILRPVPVFVIVDQQGSPLVAQMTSENGVEVSLTGAFISPTDAKQFLDRLKTDNSELAEQCQMVPASLAEIYQKNKSAQESKLFFSYIPNQEILAYAKTLLPEAIQQELKSVPLFTAKDVKSRQYITISNNSAQIIPFFFDNKQLEEIVNKYQENNPEEDATLDIEVVSLESLIQILEAKSNEMLKIISLIPLAESQQFIQNLRQ